MKRISLLSSMSKTPKEKICNEETEEKCTNLVFVDAKRDNLKNATLEIPREESDATEENEVRQQNLEVDTDLLNSISEMPKEEKKCDEMEENEVMQQNSVLVTDFQNKMLENPVEKNECNEVLEENQVMQNLVFEDAKGDDDLQNEISESPISETEENTKSGKRGGRDGGRIPRDGCSVPRDGGRPRGGGRGRGNGNSKGGRGGLMKRVSPEILENERRCKAEWFAAKETGDAASIKERRAAFSAAKEATFAAMDALRAQDEELEHKV